MPAKDAILGLIVDRPGYGYSVKQRFDECLSVAEFSESIVYGAIDSLIKDGYIEEIPSSADTRHKRRGRRNASVRSTPKGLERFDEWMAEALPPDPIRDELRMRLAVCKPRHVPRLLELVQAHEQLCVDRIAVLKQLQAEQLPADKMTLPQAIEAMLSEAEAKGLQAKLEWLQKLRPTLHRYAPSGSAGGGLREV